LIPRTIHFVWISDKPLPEYAQRNIAEFHRLNPEYEIRLHDESSLLPGYRVLFDKLTDTSSKADLLRYSVLERHGGWYFDVDYWPFRPVDDIVKAYDLQGDKIFLAEAWQRTNPQFMGNAVIACGENCEQWQTIKQRVLSINSDKRIAYGPSLFTAMVKEDETQFIIAGEAWFNGVKPDWSDKVYRHCVNGGDLTLVRKLLPATGGRLPFAMHLWAWKYGDRIETAETNKSIATYGNGSRCAAVVVPTKYTYSDGSIFVAIAKGLAANGYKAELVPHGKNTLSLCSGIPSIVVLWNGYRDKMQPLVSQCDELHIPCIRLENGFFDRKKYIQADYQGILHWASWRHQLTEPPPDTNRLKQFTSIKPMQKREGYILVIGQTPNDTQLLVSEVQGPIPLMQHVARALPEGVECYFRPHPQYRSKPNRARITLPQLPLSEDARNRYNTSGHGVGLQEALAGASFVITINSNAANEALTEGVPVLAFGPFLGIIAGAVRQATVATLAQDIEAMISGWCPTQESVDRYLQWLACRQWNRDEFAQGGVVKMLLEEAGL